MTSLQASVDKCANTRSIMRIGDRGSLRNPERRSFTGASEEVLTSEGGASLAARVGGDHYDGLVAKRAGLDLGSHR